MMNSPACNAEFTCMQCPIKPQEIDTEELGDTSTLADPAVVDELIASSPK